MSLAIYDNPHRTRRELWKDGQLQFHVAVDALASRKVHQHVTPMVAYSVPGSALKPFSAGQLVFGSWHALPLDQRPRSA
jgi:hypothetical protein